MQKMHAKKHNIYISKYRFHIAGVRLVVDYIFNIIFSKLVIEKVEYKMKAIKN
jgi:hypothetical protein